MMKLLNRIWMVMTVLCLAVCLYGCSDDDDEYIPSDLVGNWSGTHSYYNPVGGTKYQYLYIDFYSDGTGMLEYEAPTSYSCAYFEYGVSGNSVVCNGAYASTSGDMSERFNLTLVRSGDTLIPQGQFSLFILTRDGSITTDGNGNIVGSGNVEDNDDDDEPDTPGNPSKSYFDILTSSNIGWWDSKNNLFLFSTDGRVVHYEMSSKKYGSYGYLTLDARGRFSLSGRKITCTFDDVSWEFMDGTAKNEFTGWHGGVTNVKIYTIESISDYSLTLKDEQGRNWYLSND